MKPRNVTKVLGDLAGFLLISTGGTLLAVAFLLAVSQAAAGDGGLDFPLGWLNLLLVSGASGAGMVGAGILLVRRSK